VVEEEVQMGEEVVKEEVKMELEEEEMKMLG
jgi:hypothetical protein